MTSYTSPPKTFNSGDTLYASDLNTYVRDAFEALFPIGSYLHVCQAATTTENLINGAWLECNGAAVSRTTYADLNTLLSGLSYPFGSGDGSTTFNLPDLRGRTFYNHGTSSGHSDMQTLGNSDGGALANRAVKHAHTNGLSVASHTHSGSSLSASVTDPGHTHSLSPTPIYNGSGSTGPSAANAAGNLSDTQSAHTGISVSVSGNTGSTAPSLSGTIGSSGRLTDTPGYLIAGIYVIKAFK